MTGNSDKRKETRLAAAGFLALFLSAHAYAFVNLTLSGGGLTVYVGGSGGEQIASGCWARPFYERLRGGISSPYLAGILSALYLLFAFLLIRDLLCIRGPGKSLALSGILSLHPAVLSLFVSQMNHADAVFLSLLLSCGGAWLLIRKKHGWLFAAALFAAACALAPELWLYGPMLLLSAGGDKIAGARPENGGRTKGEGGAAAAVSPRRIPLFTALAALLGLALYAAGLFVMLRRYGQDLPFRPDASRLVSGMLSPLRSYQLPYSAYAPLSAALFAALAAAAVFFAACGRARPGRRLFCAGLRLVSLMLLSGVSAALFGAGKLVLTQPLLGVFFLSLVPENPAGEAALPRLPRRIAALALAAAFLGRIVYSNQMHLLKNLEFQSTLSLMTRVLDRIERTEGFVPGKTDVALLGDPGDSPLAVPHEGFEALSAFPGAEKHMAAFSESQDAALVWQILGYPLNLVSDSVRDRLKSDPAVQNMPAFPAAGSVEWVGETLVIRLSP